jgi:hypothetical protein
VSAVPSLPGQCRRPGSAAGHRPGPRVLLGLKPEAFESFVQNLFTKMGYETDQYRSSHDGSIDCMAYKRDPVAPMKIAVQAKLCQEHDIPARILGLGTRKRKP